MDFFLNSIISENERMKKVIGEEHIKLITTVIEKMNSAIKEYSNSLNVDTQKLKEPNKGIKKEQEEKKEEKEQKENKETSQNDNTSKEEEIVENIDFNNPKKEEEK